MLSLEAKICKYNINFRNLIHPVVHLSDLFFWDFLFSSFVAQRFSKSSWRSKPTLKDRINDHIWRLGVNSGSDFKVKHVFRLIWPISSCNFDLEKLHSLIILYLVLAAKTLSRAILIFLGISPNKFYELIDDLILLSFI